MIIVVVVAVAALVTLAFATGWANDKAKPGSSGRGTVTQTETKASH